MHQNDLLIFVLLFFAFLNIVIVLCNFKWNALYIFFHKIILHTDRKNEVIKKEKENCERRLE